MRRLIGFRSAAFLSATAFATASYLRSVWSLDLRRGLLLVLVGFALAVIAVIASRSEEVSPQKPSADRRIALSLTLGFALLAFFWLTSRTVHIDTICDVYIVERDSAATLLHGKNPYGLDHADPYYLDSDFARAGGWAPENASRGRLHIGYAYLPASLIALLPGEALGDIRISLVLAMALTAVLLLAMNPSWSVLLACLALLFTRLTFRMIYQGLNDPLTLALCALTVYGAIRGKRWTPFAFGLMLALKQYNLIAVPAAALLLPSFTWRAYARFLIKAGATAAAVVLPFAAWNPSAFFHDVLWFHVAQSPRFAASPIAPLWATALVTIAVAAWASRISRPHPAMFGIVFALSLTAFFVLSKQAQTNYYFLIGWLVVLSASGLSAPQDSGYGLANIKTGFPKRLGTKLYSHHLSRISVPPSGASSLK